MFGTVQSVVVCIPGDPVASGANPCPSGFVQSVTQAYLIAPSESSHFDLMFEPFDPLLAGQFFGFAFASTFFVWLISLGLGLVIKFIKSS